MRKNSVQTGDPALFDYGPDEAAPPLDALVFDRLGVPLSKEAANSMNEATVLASILKVIANLQQRTVDDLLQEGPATPQGSVVLDSIEVVYVISQFSQAYSKSLINLSGVDDDNWSSTQPLAALLFGAIKEAGE